MSTKITLYTLPPSHNAFRAELALLEKGLDYDKVTVDLFAGDASKPPFSELTPRRQVPTLVYEKDGQRLVVYESVAIIRFIDAVHPSPALMPGPDQPAELADALMRIEEFQAKLDAKNVFGSVIFGNMDREQLGDRVDTLLTELELWNTYVEGRDYLAGEQFTLADIAVFPLLMHFEAMGYDFAKRAPALAAYLARCKGRPTVSGSGWLDAFYGFVKGRNPNQVLA